MMLMISSELEHCDGPTFNHHNPLGGWFYGGAAIKSQPPMRRRREQGSHPVPDALH